MRTASVIAAAARGPDPRFPLPSSLALSLLVPEGPNSLTFFPIRALLPPLPVLQDLSFPRHLSTPRVDLCGLAALPDGRHRASTPFGALRHRSAVLPEQLRPPGRWSPEPTRLHRRSRYRRFASARVHSARHRVRAYRLDCSCVPLHYILVSRPRNGSDRQALRLETGSSLRLEDTHSAAPMPTSLRSGREISDTRSEGARSARSAGSSRDPRRRTPRASSQILEAMGRLPTSTQAPITAVIGTSTPQAVGQPSSTAQPSNSPRVEQWLNESPSGLSRPMTRSHTAAPGLAVASSAATMPITTPVPGSVPTPVASGPFQVPPTIPQPSEGTFGLPSSTPLHVALATQGLTRIPTPNTGVSASPPTSHHPAINAAVSAAARIAAAHAPLLDSTGPTPVAQPVTAEAVASGGSAGIPRQLTFNNGSLHRTVTGEASTSQPHHSSPALVGGQRTHPRPIPPVAGGSSNPMTTPAPGPQVPGVRPTDTPTDPWVAVYRYIDGIIENRLAAITGNIPRHVQSAVINYTDRFGSRLSSLDSLTEQLRVAFNQLVEQNTSLRLEEIERKLLEATPRNMEPAEPTAPPPCLLYTSPSPRDRTRSRMPSSA